MQFVDHVVKGPKTILTHPTIQDMDTDPGYEEMGRRRFFVDSANWGGGGVRLPPLLDPHMPYHSHPMKGVDFPRVITVYSIS